MTLSRAVGVLMLGLGAVALGACGGSADPPGAPRSAPPGGAHVQKAVAVRGTPVAVAVGSDAVWVADQTGGTVQRIDPETRRRVGRPIAVGRAPFAVAVGDDAVWVAGGDGSVRAIDPRTAEVREPAVGVPGANGLAVGEGGVWVTSRIAGTVTRIDPRSMRADEPIGVGAGPADVIVAAGAVWVANAAAGTVSRVDPESGTASDPVDIGGSGVLALAGGEAGIWAARTVGVVPEGVEIVRLDQESGRPIGRAVPVSGAVPLDLAVGAGGVWVTDVGGARPPGPSRPGAVTRIDPRTSEIIGRPIRVGKRPSGLAVGTGVWVANAGDRSVTPIALSP